MEEQKHSTTWAIDPVHSRVRFNTRYLLISSVSGWFTQLEGIVQSGTADFGDAGIQLTIYTNSIFTANEERDQHLRSEDFFNTQQYPVIFFESTAVSCEGDRLKITGKLHIKDSVEVVHFYVKHNGTVLDPMGNTKAGFEMAAVFNRKDFNISWNKFFDKSGMLLSDEVNIHCDLQLLKLS